MQQNTCATIIASLACLGVGTLAGCGTFLAEQAYRLEMETRQVAYPSTAFAAEEDVAPSGGGRQGVFQMGAHQIFLFIPGKIHVETRSVLKEVEDGVSKARRSVVRRIVDFEEGVVWTSRGGSAFDRGLIRLEEYERQNQNRRARVDLVDSYLRSPRLRSIGDLENYSGGGSIEAEDENGSARRRHVKLAVEPGVRWDLTVSEDLAGQFPLWLAGQLIHAVMGLPLPASQSIAVSLGGFPLSFRATVVPAEDSETVIDYKIVSLAEVREQKTKFAPPARDRERARELTASLQDPDAVLRALGGAQEVPEGVTAAELLALLEARLEISHFERVAALWTRSPDLGMNVELMRVLLRRDSDVAWPLLSESLNGTRGLEALAVAEALIAEGDPRAVDAVIRLLERRQTFADVPLGSIVPWAIEHLRVLSGQSLDELAANLADAWPAEPDAGPPEPLSVELDYWLRWAERRVRRSASRR